MRKKYRFFSIIIALIVSTLPSIAQLQEFDNDQGSEGLNVNYFTKIPPPAIFTQRIGLQKAATVSITTTYTATVPADTKTAIDYAVKIWSQLINSTIPIKILVDWKTYTTQQILADCSPTDFPYNFSNSPDPLKKTRYAIALAEAIAGQELNSASQYEITLNINKDKVWYKGTDGNTPANMYDLVSIAMHEIGHGLGLSSSMLATKSAGSWLGTWGFGDPSYGSTLDYQLLNVAEFTNSETDLTNTTSYPKLSENLGNVLVGGRVFFKGVKAKKLNNNIYPKMYAPNPFNEGSSISHLDQDSYGAGNANSLFHPQFGMAEAIHSPGEVGLALLQDLGWEVNRCITVTAPVANASWKVNQNYQIKWHDNNGGNVDITLEKWNGASFSWIKNIRVSPNNGYASVIGENTLNYIVPADVQVGDYRIKIMVNVDNYSYSPTFKVSGQPQVSQLLFTPEKSTYPDPQTIKISCSDPTLTGLTIFYTTDLSTPGPTKSLYDNVTGIYISSSKTIKAIAYKSGYDASEIAEASYVIGLDYNQFKLAQLDENGQTFGNFAHYDAQGVLMNHLDSKVINSQYNWQSEILYIKSPSDYKIGTKQKFNTFTTNLGSSVLNYNAFRIWDDETHRSSINDIKSFFKTANNAIVQVSFFGVPVSDPAIKTGFSDPWFPDVDLVGKFGGYRNRGMSAVSIDKSVPFNPNTNASGSGSEYKGVFLNQSGPPSWSGDYYKVKAKSTVPWNGKTASFLKWSVVSGQAEFIDANALETGVVFKQPNTIITSNYKPSLATNFANSFSTNGSHKFIRTGNGTLHLVYHTEGIDGKVWYETSTDNGATWQVRFSAPGGWDPSIVAVNNNRVVIVYAVIYNIVAVCYDVSLNAVLSNANALVTDSWNTPRDVNVAITTAGKILITWYNSSVHSYSIAGYYGRYGNVASNGTINWISNVDYEAGGIAGENARHGVIDVRVQSGDGLFHFAFDDVDNFQQRQIYYGPIFYDVNSNTVKTYIYSPYDNCLSGGSAFDNNTNPTFITETNGEGTRFNWIGETYGDLVSVFKDPGYFRHWYFGSGVTSTSMNKASNGYVIGWSDGYTHSYTNSSTLYELGTISSTGQYLQIGNSDNLSNMKAMGFNVNAIPYTFNISSPIGSDQIQKQDIEMNKVVLGRGGIVSIKVSSNDSIKSDTVKNKRASSSHIQFAFMLNNVTVDGNTIKFVEIPETIKITNVEELNNCLLTEPFVVTDNSNLSYDIKFSSTHGDKVIHALAKNNFINFRVELIDSKTQQVLGVLNNCNNKENQINERQELGFVVDCKGIELKEIQLRIVLVTNTNAQFSIGDKVVRLADVLRKGNIDRTKISYQGSSIIKSFALDQNFPNPFNPTTTISFAIPKAGKVVLKVYDILGKEVATLVDSYKESGQYSVVFSAPKLSSGMYVYKLTSNDYSEVKKMMLVK